MIGYGTWSNPSTSVSTRPAARDRIAELEAELARVKLELQQVKDELAALKNGGNETQVSERHDYHLGRRVITVARACKLAGVSKATASRYIRDEEWEAVKYNERNWWVYADQPLSKKSRRGV